MRKILAAVLAVVMTAGMLTGCGGAKETAGDTTAAPAAAASGTETAGETAAQEPAGNALKVVYLCNGYLGDKGFYDNAASGLYRMRDELGCEVKVIEMGNDETAYESYFLDESEKDWDIIITGTFTMRELLQDVANQYPDKKYMFFDGQIDFAQATEGNVMGITYQSNETGFMGGALAALMLDSGAEKIDADKRILGFVGSMDSPNINDFLIGYIDGIKYIDPEIRLVTNYVGSFEDVAKCYEMSTQEYNQGAQIIYAPSSQSILGAVQASAEQGRYLVACDNDIWTIMSETDSDLVANVMSSTMKNVGESLFKAVEGLQSGTYKMGENYTLGIKDGSVGLAVNENYEALVPEDIRTKLDEISEKIVSGEIKVGTAFGMETDAVAKVRDDMKP